MNQVATNLVDRRELQGAVKKKKKKKERISYAEGSRTKEIIVGKKSWSLFQGYFLLVGGRVLSDRLSN